MAKDQDIEFPDGIFFKYPHENAPNFVKAKMSIKIDDAAELLAKEAANGKEWLNIDILESRGGKLYGKIDRWEPGPGRFDRGTQQDPEPVAGVEEPDDDIPF